MFHPIILLVMASVVFTAAPAAAGLMPTMASTCQQDSLTRCTDPLKVLTNNRDLGFAATKHELNSLCPKLIDGLRCIDNFTARCLDSQHREFFHMLYAGTKQVIVDLCQDEDYQREYLSHAPCMRIVQTGYEQCAVEYQSNVRDHNGGGAANNNNNALANSAVDDPVENSKRLCCSFQNYMKCSQSVVQETCGTQTATFTRGFLDTMAGPLIQGYCLSYEPGTDECGSMEHSQQPGISDVYGGGYDEQSLDRSGTEDAGLGLIDGTEFVRPRTTFSSTSSSPSSSPFPTHLMMTVALLLASFCNLYI